MHINFACATFQSIIEVVQYDCSNFCMENCYAADKTMRYSVNLKQSFDYCSRFTINKLKKRNSNINIDMFNKLNGVL